LRAKSNPLGLSDNANGGQIEYNNQSSLESNSEFENGNEVSTVSCYGETEYVPGEYLAGDAPLQTTPGTTTLTGVHCTDSGVAQPWVAYYDEYGRLIVRIDFNAPNPTIGAASTHYHLYYWSSGKQPYEDPFHYPGVYPF